MSEARASPVTIKRTLEELGVSEEKINLLIPTLEERSDASFNDNALLLIQEELDRQKSIIGLIQEDLQKLSSQILNSIEEVRVRKSESTDIKLLKERLELLEARINGIVDALGEYVPIILHKLKERNLGLK
jgi:riboflavin synthase